MSAFCLRKRAPAIFTRVTRRAGKLTFIESFTAKSFRRSGSGALYRKRERCSSDACANARSCFWANTTGLLFQPPKLRRLRVFARSRSEEHTSELQSRSDLVCRLLLEKKKDHEDQSASRRRGFD